MLAVCVGIRAKVSVHGARVGRRLIDSHERNVGGVGALDVLEDSLIIPRNSDDTGDLLGNARVDLRRLPLGVLAGHLLDQLHAEFCRRLAPKFLLPLAEGVNFVQRQTDFDAIAGRVCSMSRSRRHHWEA